MIGVDGSPCSAKWMIQIQVTARNRRPELLTIFRKVIYFTRRRFYLIYNWPSYGRPCGRSNRNISIKTTNRSECTYGAAAIQLVT